MDNPRHFRREWPAARAPLTGSTNETRSAAVSLPTHRGFSRRPLQRKEDVNAVPPRHIRRGIVGLFVGLGVRMRLLLAFLVIAGTSWVFMAGFDAERLAAVEAREMVIATSLIGTAVLTVFLVLGERSTHTLRAIRDFMAGLVLAVAVMTTYSYRVEILTVVHRATGEYVYPTTAARTDADQQSERSVRIRRRPDGHFIARAEVGGTPLAMLVDTGASTVVLKPADAQKLGFDPERLKYSVPVHTANGTTYAASIKVRGLMVGPIWIEEVDALVAKPGTLKDSLLGMTFLNRLRSYEFSGDVLTLRI